MLMRGRKKKIGAVDARAVRSRKSFLKIGKCKTEVRTQVQSQKVVSSVDF